MRLPTIIAALAALALGACNATSGGGQQPLTSAAVAAVDAAPFPTEDEIAAGVNFTPKVGGFVLAGYPVLNPSARNSSCGFIPSSQGSTISLRLTEDFFLLIDLSGVGRCNPIDGVHGTIPIIVRDLTRLPDGSVVANNGARVCVIRPNGNHACRVIS